VNLRFSREHKLTERADFLRCYNTGRRSFSSGFVVFVRQRESGDLPWRLGLAVTKKTGNAVVRNRLRRLVREFFRLGQHNSPGGRDYVVVPKRGLNPLGLGLADISAELSPLLRALARAKPEPQ
jgi:ribonuclease P protein component